MKWYKYKTINKYNIGDEENPNWIESFVEKMIPKTASNEEIAKLEAYNGEYAIVDDGQPEVYQPTESERLEALEEAMLEMMGVAL